MSCTMPAKVLGAIIDPDTKEGLLGAKMYTDDGKLYYKNAAPGDDNDKMHDACGKGGCIVGTDPSTGKSTVSSS